jgi:hypothetical protein
MGLTRHRSDGGHSTPGAAAAEAGAPQKYEMSSQGATYPTATAPSAQGAPYQTNAALAAQASPYQTYAAPNAVPTPIPSPSPVSAQTAGPYPQTSDPRYGGAPVQNAQQYQQPALQFAKQPTQLPTQQYQHSTVAEMPTMPKQDYPQQYNHPQASQLP